MTISELVTYQNIKTAQINTTKNDINSINSKINIIREARKEIKLLKEKAEDIRSCSFNRIDFHDNSLWDGDKKNQFKSDYINLNNNDINHYINALDELADQLIDREKHLIDAKNDYVVVLEQLNDAWNWLTGEIKKLFN